MDHDTHWAKSFWAFVTVHLHLQVLLSTSHYPQHDRQMEQQNQTLEIALCAYVAGSKSNWAKWLPALALAYNSTIHTSMGYSPFFLLYGFEPHSLANFTHGNSHKVDRPLSNHSAHESIQELQFHCALAQDSLAKASTHQAIAHDSHYQAEEFGVGDEVLITPHSLDLGDMKGT